MNIFATSNCPIESAKYLDDKRKVKMPLECTQMLFTAIYKLFPEDYTYYDYCSLERPLEGKKSRIKKAYYMGNIRTYSLTHPNHPCNVWLRKSGDNYLWLLVHLEGLFSEYTAIYGKTHKSEQYLDIFYKYLDKLDFIGITKFPNCAANKDLGICYKHVKDVNKAYQLYLMDRWTTDKRTPTWYGEGRL